jgi:hypothetical protein
MGRCKNDVINKKSKEEKDKFQSAYNAVFLVHKNIIRHRLYARTICDLAYKY